MTPKKTILALILPALAFTTNTANAISIPVTIDFLGMNAGQPGAASAYYGKANIAANATEGCSTLTTKCYFEDGFSVGSVIDPLESNAHIHRGGNTSTRLMEYHGDSGGIYIRADDLSAFSLDSFYIDSSDPTGTNPNAGEAGSYWEVLGFNTELNADLTTWNWTTDPTYSGKRVAYQQIANGTKATVVLNDQFKNVKAVWIHYVNHPRVPTDAIEFDMKVGTIQLSAPILTPIPCP